MKQLVIAVALLLASGAAAISCSGEASKESADTTKKEIKGEQKGESFAVTTNIRYVDFDTVMANYEYAKEQSKVLEQIAMQLQQYQNQLGSRLAQKQNEIQQKMQNNAYTSEDQYKADVSVLQNLDQSSQVQYAKRAEADNARVNEIQKKVKEAIDEFVVEYNKDKKYDAILDKSSGIYFNPALDITGEIVKGLNEAYKAKKGGDSKKEAATDDAKKAK